MDYGINLATAADSWKVVRRAGELGFTRATGWQRRADEGIEGPGTHCAYLEGAPRSTMQRPAWLRGAMPAQDIMLTTSVSGSVR